jgi:hypothetical protein
VRRAFIAASALSYAASKLINPVAYTPGRLHELNFKASPGWMNGFLRRSGLVLRRRTNNHRLTRLQRVPFVLRCVWRARQIMQSAPAAGETGDPITGRFRPHDVYNSDQVPLEDEDKDGRSPHATGTTFSPSGPKLSSLGSVRLQARRMRRSALPT